MQFRIFQWSSFMNTKTLRSLAQVAGVSLASFGALVLSTGAQAAVDVTAATAGIADAQTAVLAVLAVMITMAAAVFGVRKVLKLLGR
jgi:S-formylglutathione hydrolase FrmB